MSATRYYDKITTLLARIHDTQTSAIEQAGQSMAKAIAAGKRVYLFGSGHSVIPVMDVFPRYGSFVGFFPLYDPRLMWWKFFCRVTRSRQEMFCWRFRMAD